MKKRKISIKDVAEKAGVSPTTVSRVINNSEHPVNIKTKMAVEEAIAKLNYHPNRLAQALITNKSKLIGVIVHDISDAYFAEMVKGIEEITSAHDYIVNIYNTERDIDKELRAVKMLIANQAEAIIFTGGHLLDDYYYQEMEQYIKELQAQNCVIVSVTDHPFDIKKMEIGNKLAAKLITEYLINKGHKKIAYINGPEILNTTKERLKGYQEALIKHNLPVKKELILTGDFSFEGGRKAALDLITNLDKITAVVAANDETALGLIWELKKEGYNIPEEISVVGIGNIPASKYSYPPLTTVSLPLKKLGTQIGNYVIDELEQLGIFKEMKVELGLIERESVEEN